MEWIDELAGLIGIRYAQRDGIRKPINRAYLILVAVDGNGKPVEVPRLIVETEAEKAEWEAGIRRREMRRQRQEEGF